MRLQMIADYESELLYFKNLCSKMRQDDEAKALKSYLFELLDFNTTNDIIGYYIATKRHNIILKNFETDMNTFDDVSVLKKVLISCFIDELLKKYNQTI